jgi:serine/threonine protein kinase
VLVGKYAISCDMWSLGVLVYIMLTGDMPFSGKNTQETIERVKKGTFDIKDRKFRKLSQEAQKFISSLLVKNP